MITRVESYNQPRIISFKGKPSPELIEEIKWVGTRKAHNIFKNANDKGVPVNEKVFTSIQEWMETQIKAVTEYMQRFHDDVELSYKDNSWVFKHTKNGAFTSFDAHWESEKAFSSEITGGRIYSIGRLIKKVTPSYVHDCMLNRLINDARSMAGSANSEIRNIKTDECLAAIDKFAHDLKKPQSYLEEVKPEIDILRNKIAAHLEILRKRQEYSDINEAIMNPFYDRLLKLLNPNSKNRDTKSRIINSAKREILDMSGNAALALRKVDEGDLQRYVDHIQSDLKNLDTYADSFPDYVRLRRSPDRYESKWIFSIDNLFFDSEASRTIPNKPEESFVDTITNEINELMTKVKHEDIEKELLKSSIQGILENGERYQHGHQQIYERTLSHIEELAKRTHQEERYQKLLEELANRDKARQAKRLARERIQNSNQALFDKFVQSLNDLGK